MSSRSNLGHFIIMALFREGFMGISSLVGCGKISYLCRECVEGIIQIFCIVAFLLRRD